MGWMEQFLDQQDARREEARRQSQLQAMASTTGPAMFRDLCQTVGAALQIYAQRRSEHNLKFEPRADSFRVMKSTGLPMFSLHALLRPQGIIDVTVGVKKSTSDDLSNTGEVVQIVARSKDRYLFQAKGADYSTEEMAQYLLLPLLSLLP
jgi:hypothetical protein